MASAVRPAQADSDYAPVSSELLGNGSCSSLVENDGSEQALGQAPDVVLVSPFAHVESDYGTCFKVSFNLVNRLRVWILLFWTGTMIWGGATGMNYIRSARDNMVAPDGSRAALDQAAFEREFQEVAEATQLILLVKCNDDAGPDCTVACPTKSCALANFEGRERCDGFNDVISNFSQQATELILDYSKHHGVEYEEQVLGFYQFAGGKQDLVKCQFVNGDGRQTFMVFTTNRNIKGDIRYASIDYIIDHVLPLLNNTDYNAGLTGMDAMCKEGSQAAVHQSEAIDGLTMPFAFLLLAYMVRSWRLLVISLLNMGMSIATSLGLLNLLTEASGKYPMTTTTSFVEVLGLAMGVDYSLFLLRRYRDEIKNGREPEHAVRIMLAHAGHVVVMSALTICCVFAGFLFMKSTDLMVQGLACVVTIACCLMVNITVTPALLLLFPHFFSEFSGETKPGDEQTESVFARAWRRFQTSCCTGCRKLKQACGIAQNDDDDDDEDRNGRARRRPSSAEQSLLAARTPGPNTVNSLISPGDGRTAERLYLTSPTVAHKRPRGGPYKGRYFRLLTTITKWPSNLITLVLIYICVIPFALQAFDITRNNNLMNAIPRDSKAGNTYRDLMDGFSGGMLMPTYLMVEADPNVAGSAIHEEVFKQIVEVSKLAANRTNMPLTAFTSIALFQGIAIPYALVEHQGERLCKYLATICSAYKFVWAQSVNQRKTAALIAIILTFDSMSSETEDFVGEMFRLIDEFQVRPPVTSLRLAGVQVGMVEDMRISFSEFPLLVGLTCVVVFTLVGIMLKSAFVIVRLTLTVVLPLAAVFGLSVLVYQKGILNWTGIPQLHGSSEGFFWYVPLLTFTITIGLALDYDVFLILRIREHRFAGLSIRAAILRSMWEVNSTIVACGGIMTLAFGSLMISSTAAVNQMAFILATSVLFDAFVVQSVVVPCIMSFADANAWWPSNPPMESLVSFEDEVEQRNQVFQSLMLPSTLQLD